MPKNSYVSREKSSRLVDFRNYCRNNDYSLLEGDYRFIDGLLRGIPLNDCISILEHYIKEWSLGMSECENVELSQGIGRRRANTWMRQHMENYNTGKRINPWNKCFD